MPLTTRLRVVYQVVRGYLALAATLIATGAIVPPRRSLRDGHAR